MRLRNAYYCTGSSLCMLYNQLKRYFDTLFRFPCSVAVSLTIQYLTGTGHVGILVYRRHTRGIYCECSHRYNDKLIVKWRLLATPILGAGSATDMDKGSPKSSSFTHDLTQHTKFQYIMYLVSSSTIMYVVQKYNHIWLGYQHL